VETIRDYMEDYQAHLNNNLFDLLVDDIIDTFLITYLTNLRKASKLRIPSACERIRQDVGAVTKMFSKFKSAKNVKEDFEVIDSIVGLLNVSPSIFALDYYAFAKRYGPNLPFVESLIKARDDLDRQATNDILESVRRKAETTSAPDQPTIFNRLQK